MRHSNKERDNVAESRPGSNTGLIVLRTCLQSGVKVRCLSSGSQGLLWVKMLLLLM